MVAHSLFKIQKFFYYNAAGEIVIRQKTVHKHRGLRIAAAIEKRRRYDEYMARIEAREKRLKDARNARRKARKQLFVEHLAAGWGTLEPLPAPIPIYNGYEILFVEDDFCPSYDVAEEVYEAFKPQKVYRRSPLKHASQREVYGPYWAPPEATYEPDDRLITLMKALRERIRTFQWLRLPQRQRDDNFFPRMHYDVYRDTVTPITAIPEMEDAHGSDQPVTLNQASNVVLTETQDESSTIPVAKTIDWGSLSSSDVKTSYTAVTDRWLELANFTWSSSQQPNTVVYSTYLPVEAIRNPTTKVLDLNNPNKLVFNMHRLWKGDIEIKVHVNSNKFQIGQLQCSWYYEPQYDNSYNPWRKNIYTRSQTDHVLVSASSSNEATLYIPYKSHLPYLNTRNRIGIEYPLVLGHFTIMVLNPLTVAGTTPDSCYGTVFVRFPNSEFTGMIATNVDKTQIAVPEMEFVQLAEKVLHTVNTVTNMDAPTDVRPSQNIVPQASHSWSVGRNQPIPLMPLRLDPLGTTSAIQDNQYEMTTTNLASKFGLFKRLVWKSSSMLGTTLDDFPVAPIVDKEEYSTFSSSVQNSLDSYCIPPVGVVSSLYAYWRGSIEYRFDVVCSQFHTGRLLIAYVPGASSGTNVTLDMAKASPHIVFTLNEIAQFSYTVPYVADRPFWPRRYAGNYERDNVGSPSHLYIFVLNPLIPMESVADTVYINVYMRGGSDFELSVPAQPSLGLPLNANVILPNSDYVIMRSGYAPYYFGTYYNFKTTAGKQMLVSRYGPSSGHVAYVDIGKYKSTDQKSYYFEIDDVNLAAKILDDNKKLVPVKYFVIIPDADLTSLVLLPVKPNTADRAKKIVQQIMITVKNAWSASNRQRILDQIEWWWFTDESNNTYTHDNPLLRPLEVTLQDLYAYPEGEREEVSNSIATGGTLSSTGNGYMLFGENFGDLKDLCRRFQLYSSHLIKFDKGVIDLSKCSVILPLIPQGLTLDLGTASSINQVFNRCRDGVIPIVASGFRYYRGGLRFKIITPMMNKIAISVQHRPDRRLRSLKPIACNTVETAESVFNHGYASYIQLTGVNGILEFEVPFYQNGCYGLLQQPRITQGDVDYYYSLGEIAITAHGVDAKVTQLPLMIFYSIADDMDFTTYQGFMPMVLLDDIPINKEEVTRASPEMGLWSTVEGQVEKKVENISGKLEEKAETLMDKMTKKVETIADKLTENATEKTDMLFKKLQEIVEPGEGVTAVRESLRDTGILRNLLFSIAHCLAARSITNVVIAIVQFLVDIGILGLDLFTKCSSVLSNLFTSLRGSKKEQEEPVAGGSGVQATTESDFSDSSEGRAATGFITLLVTGITSLFNVKKYFSTESKHKDWATMLTKDIGDISRTSNSVFLFLKNLFSVIEDMIEWIMSKINPSYLYAKYIIRDYPEYKEWIEEVTALLAPGMKAAAMYDINVQQRVYSAHSIGDTFVRHLDNDKELRKVMQPILNYQQKLSNHVHDLEAAGQHPYVRKMPYSIRITGPPGIGKSHLSHTLCADLLKSINYKTPKNMVFTLNAGTSKYWDQCDGQPVIDIDDLWAIRSGEHLEAQIAALFAIHSPVVLCPPKAELSEKKMRYNPEIFMQKTNDAFYVPPNICRDAVLRRAHVLIKCELTDLYKVIDCPHCEKNEPITNCDPKWLTDYHHLAFYYTFNPLVNGNWSQPMPYSTLITILKKDFRDNRDRETELFNQRLTDEQELREEMPDSQAPLSVRVATIKCSMEKRRLDLISKTFNDAEYKPTTADWAIKYLSNYMGMAYGKLKDMITPAQPEMALIRNKAYQPRLYTKDDSSWLTNPFIVDPATGNIVDDYIEEVFMMGQPEMDGPARILAEHPEIAFEYSGTTWSDFYNVMVNEWRKVSDEDIAKATAALTTVCKRFYERGHFNMRMVKQMYKLEHDYPNRLYVEMAAVLTKRVTGIEAALEQISYSDREWHHIVSHLHSGECAHSRADVSNVIYLPDQEAFVHAGSHFLTKCAGNCITQNALIMDIWYYKWLIRNKNMHRLYKKGCFDMLPTYLKGNREGPVEDCSSILTRVKEYARRIFDKYVVGTLRYIWKFITEQWTMIMCFLAPMLLSMGSIALIDYTAAKSQAYAKRTWTAPESATAYAKTQSNVNLNRKVPMSKPESEVPQVEHVVSRIQKNTFRITAMFDGKIRQCTCLVLEGRKLLILRHYIEEYKTCPPNTRYFGRYDYQPKTANVYGIEFDLMGCSTTFYNVMTDKGDYKSHIGILTLPKEFPESKSIVRFIARQKDHEYMNGNCQLVSFGGTVEIGVRVKRENKFPHTVVSEDTTAIVMDDVYTYTQHGRGMCGTMLVAENLERPIIGVHVGGVCGPRGYGIAEILTSEMFEEALTPPPKTVHVQSVLPDLKTMDFSKIDLETAIFPYGVVADSYGQHQSGETKFIKSLLHGRVEPVLTEPNPLKKNDPRLPPGTSPLKAGCEHFGRPPISFPEKLLQEAKDDLEEVILSTCRPPRVSVGVVDEEIAILGCPSLPGYEPLMWTTSEGFPLKSIRTGKKSGKKWLFDLEETSQGYKLNGMHPELRRLLDLETEMRKRGIKPFTVFTDSLKDTCLPIDKCRVPGKTRIFSISPVQFTINFKRYFLDFMVAYRTARFDAEHGIGINVDSMEWTELAGRLQRHGGKIIAGDYKNFGPGLMKSAALQAFDIIISWYAKHGATEEEQRVRKIMALEVVDSPHLATNLIYYTPCGIPSGSPITTELNSLVNSIYIRCIWKITTNLSYADMASNISIVTYGDDVLIGITDDVCDKFNTQTMADAFAMFNITFTDADKSDQIVLYRDIHTCTFLKRAFIPHPSRLGVWLASIDSVSVGSCLNWITKVGNHVENTLTNCTAALELAYGHGPDYYENLRSRIIAAVGDVLGERFICKRWAEKDAEIFSVMPAVPEMEEAHQYEGWNERVQWAECATWYACSDVLGVLRTMRNLNFSLQEQRSEGLQLLNGLIPISVVSPNSRFTRGRFFCEERPGIQELMSNIRLSLAFKDSHNGNTNGRSAYNDAIVSFHKSVTALINGIISGNMTYTREKFENTYNLVWH